MVGRVQTRQPPPPPSSYGVIGFMRALMTFEADVIADAQARLKAAVSLAEAWLPRSDGVMGTLRGMVGGGGGGGSGPGGSLTPVQLEGVLIYAEASLILALCAWGGRESCVRLPLLASTTSPASAVNLMEESIMALVRCGLAVRAGWRYQQLCDK